MSDLATNLTRKTLLTRLQLHFDDISRNGRAPIQMTRLSPDAIRDRALETLKHEPSSFDYEWESACMGEPYHTEKCLQGQDFSIECIQERIAEAKRRLRGYRTRHWLKECIQNPQRAQGRPFLKEGLMQESFVYRRQVRRALQIYSLFR